MKGKLSKKRMLSVVISSTFAVSILLSNFSAGAKELANDTKTRKSQSTGSESYIRQIPKVINTNGEKNSAVQAFPKAFEKSSSDKKIKEGEFIVKLRETGSLKAESSTAKVKELLSNLLGKDVGVTSVENLGSANVNLVKFTGGKSPEDISKNLVKLYGNQIEYAEPNYIVKVSDVGTSWVPSDPKYKSQWGLKNTGQNILGSEGLEGIDINAEPAWDITKGRSSVVVGVIDTGVDITHQDLKNNIWVNTKEIPNNGKDDDGNGFIDDVNGWDFVKNTGKITDPYGHGTHVSGTIAASSNTVGVIGVAPNVKIMPIRFLDENGSGDDAGAIKAINYAAKMGVKITNNSWGGGEFGQALYDAIKSSNALFVAAAGNDYNNNNDDSPVYPASYDLSNILSVASINNYGDLSWFSNYGATTVDVAAPGENIISTLPGNNYIYASGTSMATPHAAGVAALVLSKTPASTTDQIKNSIVNSAVPLSSLKGKVVSGGMISAALAIGGGLEGDIPGKVLTSSSVSGTLENIGNPDDVYNLKLSKGDIVNLKLTGDAGTDFDLYIYDKNAKTVKTNEGMVAYSEKPGTSAEAITYKIPEDGVYYFDVFSYSGSGKYTLTVNKGLTKGTYEDTNSLLTYTSANEYANNWWQYFDTKASGSYYTQTNSKGSYISIAFSGTGFEFTAAKNNIQGIAKVTIDGTSSNVDLYSASSLYKQTVFSKKGLKSGVHNVKIEWTGMRSPTNRKSSLTFINIDTVTVY